MAIKFTSDYFEYFNNVNAIDIDARKNIIINKKNIQITKIILIQL